AMLLPSPTYDGVVSDIAGIAAVCHERGVPLIVDAAHGAHLGFLDRNVPQPVPCGADLVIMSLHKTLPSLTQTGLLHVSGELVDPAVVAQSLTMFETSSPSYVFMASIDGCLHAMTDPALFAGWAEKIAYLRKTAAACTGVHLRIPEGVFAFDESKLILSCDGYSGGELAEILRERFAVEPEMIARGYVLLMTGAGDTWEMTERLRGALTYLGEHSRPVRGEALHSAYGIVPECVMTLADARMAETEVLPLEEAEGRISAEFVMPYPPGIPLLAPGERITSGHIAAVREGTHVLTTRGEFDGTLPVIREKNGCAPEEKL
ncbi:MAG: decarboxylase, partial [Eubacteriales bacterium]